MIPPAMPLPPLSLSLFGAPRLLGPHGPLPAASPRRLAVLAVIAASGSAGITRDRLVGLLWPDADQARARHSLNQTLYALRRDAQADLTVGSADLRLDPDVVACDVVAFDRAVAEGRPEDALAAYAGPFLDGFFIADAPEFAHWADVERDRRARQAIAAAEGVAVAEEQAGRNAAPAWTRAAELDPFNGRIARHVVAALANAGDRAGALRAGEQHIARLARELEAPADPALVALLESLRAPAPVAAPGPARGASPAAPAAPAAPMRAFADDAPAASPASIAAPAAASVARRSIARRPWPWLLAAGAAIAAGVAAFRPSVPFEGGEYVVIGEFANLTRDTLLSRVTTTAFTSALAQSNWVAPLPRPRVQEALRRMRRPDTTTLATPELAREVALRAHVPLVVTGQVMQSGGDLQVTTEVTDAESGRVLRARSRRVGSRDELLGAIDALASELRRDLGEARSSVQASVPLPEVTTSSLEALRLYAEGRRLYEQNQLKAGSDLYKAAIALDSNFARARAAYGGFLVFNNQIRDAEPHLAAAERLAASLPPAEAAPVMALVHTARGKHELTATAWRAYLARYPQDALAWRSYASTLQRLGRGREAIAAFDSVARRMPLRSNDHINIAVSWDAVASSATGAAARAATDSARAAYERAFAIDSTLLTFLYYNHQYGAVLVRLGMVDSARAVFTRMLPRAAGDRARGLRSLGFLDAHEGRWRSAARRFAAAAEANASAGTAAWTSMTRDAALAGSVLALAGDAAAARAPLRQGARWAREHAVETRAARYVAIGLALAGDPAGAGEQVRWMRSAMVPDFAPSLPAMSQAAGMALLASGQAAAARDTLAAALAGDSTEYGHALVALAQAGAGDHRAAAREWGALRRASRFGVEEQFLVQLAAWHEGRALEAIGDRAGARAAYEAFVAAFPAAVPAAELPAAVADARARIARLR